MVKISVFLISIVIGATAVAQGTATHPSKVSEVLSTYTPAAEDHSPEAMAKAAGAFLGRLGDDLKKQALLPFDSDEKAKWTNVPPRGPQGGVRLGDCDDVTCPCASPVPCRRRRRSSGSWKERRPRRERDQARRLPQGCRDGGAPADAHGGYPSRDRISGTISQPHPPVPVLRRLPTGPRCHPAMRRMQTEGGRG